MKYHEQMKHPLWQKKRLEVLEYSGFQCEDCGDSGTELHVHHPFYKRGAMIWEYDVEELMCLCSKCHKNAHAIDEKIKKELADRNVNSKMVLGFIKSMTYNPYTKLESLEEISGFLAGFGIIDNNPAYAIIESEIVKAGGIADSPFSNNFGFLDISKSLQKPADSLEKICANAAKENKKRMAEYHRRVKNGAN